MGPIVKYTEKKFSVASPGTQRYADNWERTFRGDQRPIPKDFQRALLEAAHSTNALFDQHVNATGCAQCRERPLVSLCTEGARLLQLSLMG